jgi:hypothetical protein
MLEHAGRPRSERRLLSRPQEVIDVEQKRHDRAQVRGLTAFFFSLVVGGGLAFFIENNSMFGGFGVLQAILACVVFVLPLVLSFIALCRVPPPPFEALGDARRDMDRKEKEWRVMILSQIFIFGLTVVENIWLWPRHSRMPIWTFALVTFFPMMLMVFVAIYSLYMRPGWLNPDLCPVLDDEATRSFRARAQRLGYLVLLFILLGFCVLARIDAQSAAHYLPLGLALGIALPVLYFVYLDWQASRSG